VLNLGKEARMNQPGSMNANWRWRSTEEMLSASAFQSLRDLTHTSGRSGGLETPQTDAALAAAS
jgi:4-alpha-glucanotransferase